MMTIIESQAQRDALIHHCRCALELYGKSDPMYAIYSIALAALEAEPVAYVHPAYLQTGALGFDASVGRLAPAQVELYTALPVPALKPVVLPDLRQSVSGERYVWSEGVANYRDDVIEIIRTAGIPIAGENQ